MMIKFTRAPTITKAAIAAAVFIPAALGSVIGIAAGGGGGTQSASAIVSSDGYSVVPASVAGTLPPSVRSIVSSFAAGTKGSEEEVVLVFKSSVQNSEISTISQALLNTSPGVSATTSGNVLRVRGTASALSGV